MSTVKDILDKKGSEVASIQGDQPVIESVKIMSQKRIGAVVVLRKDKVVGIFSERMWVVVVGLGALFLPLSRIIPPLYVWRIRSRVYRWYGKLRTVEQAIENVPPDQRAEVYATQLRRLNEIDESVNQISIPLSFAEGLYDLRSHINFVRKRVVDLTREVDG